MFCTNWYVPYRKNLNQLYAIDHEESYKTYQYVSYGLYFDVPYKTVMSVTSWKFLGDHISACTNEVQKNLLFRFMSFGSMRELNS